MEEMNMKCRTVDAGVGILVVLMLIASGGGVQAQFPLPASPPNSISVMSVGKAAVEPDTVEVRAQVSAQTKNLAEAYQEVQKVLQRVQEALAKAGIGKERITVDGPSFQSAMPFFPGMPMPHGPPPGGGQLDQFQGLQPPEPGPTPIVANATVSVRFPFQPNQAEAVIGQCSEVVGTMVGAGARLAEINFQASRLEEGVKAAMADALRRA